MIAIKCHYKQIFGKKIKKNLQLPINTVIGHVFTHYCRVCTVQLDSKINQGASQSKSEGTYWGVIKSWSKMKYSSTPSSCYLI